MPKPVNQLEKNQCIEDYEKVLKQLVHLHLCEQEGISSGQPTPTQWFKAVDEASNILNKWTQQE